MRCPVFGLNFTIRDEWRDWRVCCPHCRTEFTGLHPPARPDTDEASRVRAVLEWYNGKVKPLLLRLDADKARELDADVERINKALTVDEGDLEVCFLGNAGIGKSTLINALVAGKEVILPAGGVGPLTAQALRVRYGDVPHFEVEYHGGDRLNQLVFGLEQQSKRAATAESGVANADQDSAEKDQSQRTASLLVTGKQKSQAQLPYLLDSLRAVLGQERKHGTKPNPEDEPRLERLGKALQVAARKGETYRRTAAEDTRAFRDDLHAHAAGFLAPLIKTLTVSWPSPLLRDGIELVDLPGVGVVDDSYRRVTFNWVRERARGIVLVVGNRGLQETDAELLRSSGFLNRLVYAADDPTADHVILLIACTRMDDTAKECYYQHCDRPLADHFADVCQEAVGLRRDEVRTELARIWPPDDTHPDNVRREIVDRLANGLRVHPLSALQYRDLLTEDPQFRPFIKTAEQSGIPRLQESLRALVRERRESRARRLRELRDVFCSQVVTGLRVLVDHWQAEEESVRQAEQLRGQLEAFLKPLSDEFQHRQGAFREFLRETLPARIDAVVADARERARKDIQAYLDKMGKAHHNILKAAIDRAAQGKSYKGQTAFPRIDLPQDFALRFEEPVAEAWGKQILTDIRRRTKEYADDCLNLVDRVVEWAQKHAGEIPTRQIELQRDALRASARKLEQVGQEVANKLRDIVRQRLVETLRMPVQQGCEAFVDAGHNKGEGLKKNILDLLGKLADSVTRMAAETAIKILRACFGEVEKEITVILETDKNPLGAAADALLLAHQQALQQHGAVERQRVATEIRTVLAASPCEPSDGTNTERHA